MAITHSRVCIDQPGKGIANPARGKLNREKGDITLSSFAPENLVSRERFGRPAPCQPTHFPHSG